MPRMDADLVRCLVREQFPQWAAEPVRPVDPGGWDNRTFRIGESLSARLPSAVEYVAAVDKEQCWLPVLALHLPLRVPTPVARGRPGCGYPWAWSLYRWLPGEPARADRLRDLVTFARDLARFLAALHRVDPGGGPTAGEHNFWRGGPLSVYDDQTRRLARTLAGIVDETAVLAVWDAAVSAPYPGEPVWVHGDVTASNLLVEDGRLTAVIDFGSCAVGDPACDQAIAWTFLTGESRTAFRQSLPVEPTSWARARGWALWKALLTAADPDGAGAARRYGWRLDPLDLVRDLIADQA